MTASSVTRDGPPWTRAYQICVVVADLQRAIAFYESLGIGPFRDGPSGHTTRRLIRGIESPDTRLIGAIQREFLERHGEGVVHLCAYTDDLERDIAWMRDRRETDVISYGELSDGGSFAYFDTQSVGGLVLELYELGPDGEVIPG